MATRCLPTRCATASSPVCNLYTCTSQRTTPPGPRGSCTPLCAVGAPQDLVSKKMGHSAAGAHWLFCRSLCVFLGQFFRTSPLRCDPPSSEPLDAVRRQHRRHAAMPRHAHPGRLLAEAQAPHTQCKWKLTALIYHSRVVLRVVHVYVHRAMRLYCVVDILLWVSLAFL